jgi:hypothetical protein
MALIEGPSEGELLRMLQDCNRKAEGVCRQLAHKRGDTRWLSIGKMYAACIPKVTALANRKTGALGTLILPENYRRPNWQ